MAIAVQVANAVPVYVDTGGANALELLGYSRNGAEPAYEGFFLNVPSDQYGGDDGPPVDVQFLGEIARIRLQLTEWDVAILDKVSPRLYGGTAGQWALTDVGALMFGDSKTHRLVLGDANTDANLRRNFPRAINRGAVEINIGTKFSELIMDWEAHRNASDVLFNTTVT